MVICATTMCGDITKVKANEYCVHEEVTNSWYIMDNLNWEIVYERNDTILLLVFLEFNKVCNITETCSFDEDPRWNVVISFAIMLEWFIAIKGDFIKFVENLIDGKFAVSGIARPIISPF